NPYAVPPSYFSDDVIHSRLLFFGKHIKHAIVQDYELYPHVRDYYERVHVLPLACRTDQIPYAYPSVRNREPIVIHAPTNREFKGSEHVERAVADLKGHVSFRYQAVERMSHELAMKAYL